MKIGLAIPVVDGVPGECYNTHLMLAAHMARGCELVILECLNVFPHDRAREYLIEQAVTCGCERVLFLDSDVVVPPEAFEKLMLAMDDNHGVAMVTGHAYQRGYPYYATYSKYNEITKQVAYCDFVPNSGVYDIDSTGFSLVLINMAWVKDLKKPFFQMVPANTGGGAVWEDAYFCHKIKSVGGRILAHTGVRCGHLGFRVDITDENVEYLRKRDFEDGGTTNFA